MGTNLFTTEVVNPASVSSHLSRACSDWHFLLGCIQKTLKTFPFLSIFSRGKSNYVSEVATSSSFYELFLPRPTSHANQSNFQIRPKSFTYNPGAASDHNITTHGTAQVSFYGKIFSSNPFYQPFKGKGEVGRSDILLHRVRYSVIWRLSILVIWRLSIL